MKTVDDSAHRRYCPLYSIFFVSILSSTATAEVACLKKIAFASCNKNDVEQPLWNPITAFDPDMFIWTGDAVYLPSDSAKDATSLERELRKQKESSAYVSFLASRDRLVEGVWDDHDFGHNDAGKSDVLNPNELKEKVAKYLDFISVPRTSERYDRSGLYSAHHLRLCDTDEGIGNGFVRLVFLDTRSHRDDHYIPSVGGVSWLPMAAVIAAMIRWLSAAIGVGAAYEGDVLSQEQWQWFERELIAAANVDDSFVIIVSSIQVLTSNPIVESWGHYPLARKKLLALIRKYARSFVILSGDVHYAEVASAEDDFFVEVTSSGMTHTCTTPWFGFFCRWMLRTFASHRRVSEIKNPKSVSVDSTHDGLNFGTMLFRNDGQVRISVRDRDGEEILRVTRQLNGKSRPRTPGNNTRDAPSIYSPHSAEAFLIFVTSALGVAIAMISAPLLSFWLLKRGAGY